MDKAWKNEAERVQAEIKKRWSEALTREGPPVQMDEVVLTAVEAAGGRWSHAFSGESNGCSYDHIYLYTGAGEEVGMMEVVATQSGGLVVRVFLEDESLEWREK